jgi:hypothetical protein
MHVKKTLLIRSGLLALALHAGALQAHTTPLAATDNSDAGARVKRSPVIVVPIVATGVLMAKLVRLALAWEPSPRGMVVCRDTTSQALCRAALPTAISRSRTSPMASMAGI